MRRFTKRKEKSPTKGINMCRNPLNVDSDSEGEALPKAPQNGNSSTQPEYTSIDEPFRGVIQQLPGENAQNEQPSYLPMDTAAKKNEQPEYAELDEPDIDDENGVYAVPNNEPVGTVSGRPAQPKVPAPNPPRSVSTRGHSYENVDLPSKSLQPPLRPRARTLSPQLPRRDAAPSNGLGDEQRGKSRDESHKKEPWFHGKISRKVAEELLASHGLQTGLFLVRNTSIGDDTFALSLCVDGKVYHNTVEVLPTGLYLFVPSKHVFSSLVELVDYYTHHSRSTLLRLRMFCPSPLAIQANKIYENRTPYRIGDQ